jgi:hypothetical protein
LPTRKIDSIRLIVGFVHTPIAIVFKFTKVGGIVRKLEVRAQGRRRRRVPEQMKWNKVLVVEAPEMTFLLEWRGGSATDGFF